MKFKLKKITFENNSVAFGCGMIVSVFIFMTMNYIFGVVERNFVN